MSTKRRSKKPVYTITGVAIDQETIIRQRSQIEDYVRENSGKEFRKTSVRWNMNKAGNFEFSIEFYA
jgi:hypothetical protein